MTKTHYISIFLFIMTLGLGLYLFVGLGNFPVAIVNSHVITEKSYRKNMTAIDNYYEAAEKTYRNVDLGALVDDRTELGRLSLEQLIENQLVQGELEARLGGDYDQIVSRKMGDIKNQDEFVKAATALYGLSFADLSELFLAPAAEREILDGKLLLEKTTFDEWLVKAKGEASVTILISSFAWKTGEGVVKE